MLSSATGLHKTTYGIYPQVMNAKEEFEVLNPATGKSLCRVAYASGDIVNKAIDDAQYAFASGIWSKAPAIHRSKVLSKLARALEERISDLARLESMQTGRTIREMETQLGRLPEWLDYYAAILRTHQGFVAPTQGKLLNYVQRVPLGVVAQITPFNHPLLIAIKKIAPALAAGNSVIVKPSELAPITVLEFAEMAGVCGVPRGVLTVLPGFGPETGKAVVSHPHVRKVDITAGTRNGRAIGGTVGSNLAAFTSELGGKAPIVIFDDADLESAVNGAAFAAFIASGQTCVAGSRIIIQDGIYETFISHFIEKAKSITRRMGDPLNPQSAMGTIISLQHLQRVEEFVSRSSGKVLVGGCRMHGTSALDGYDFSQGAFFPPTIVSDVDLEDDLWREEIFGPVVVVQQFSTESEGIALANDCKYGLGAGIWTKDLSRAHRISAEIEAGLCWVNTHHRSDPSSPWGGMKESGTGRGNGLEAFEAYSQSKSTIVNIADPEESRRTDDWFSEEYSGQRYG